MPCVLAHTRGCCCDCVQLLMAISTAHLSLAGFQGIHYAMCDVVCPKHSRGAEATALAVPFQHLHSPCIAADCMAA